MSVDCRATAPVGAEGRKVLFSLQYLRAVAAFMVIYFHAVLQVRLFAGDHALLPLIGSGGVDIFFVLSGFMMWYMAEQAPAGPGEFIRRRIVRIVPLYWAVTLFALAIAGVAPALLRSTVFDLRHAIASLLFVPWRNPALASMNANEVIVPVIVPGWTINFEMVFYLLFALTLRSARAMRLPLLGVLLLALYWVSGSPAAAASPLVFYHRDILFEFLAGSMLGAMRLERRPMPGAWTLGLIIGGLAVSLCVEPALDMSVPRILLLGVPAVAIMVGALRAEAAGAVPSWPLLNALGNASFSTYLTHGFVLAAMRIAVARLGLGSDAPAFQAGFVICALIVAAGVGLVTYQLVERPLVRLASRTLSRRGGQTSLQAA